MKHYRMDTIETFVKSIYSLDKGENTPDIETLRQQIKDSISVNFDYVCNSNEIFSLENKIKIFKALINLTDTETYLDSYILYLNNLNSKITFYPKDNNFTISCSQENPNELPIMLESLNLHKNGISVSKNFKSFNYDYSVFDRLLKDILNKFNTEILFRFVFFVNNTFDNSYNLEIRFNTIQLMYKEITEIEYKRDKYKERMI